MKRIIAAALVLVMMLFALCSCALEKSEVVGTWKESYRYNGSYYEVALALRSDGYYGYARSKNGVLDSTEGGEYEIKGRTVILYDSSSSVYHGRITKYKYQNGELVNNGHRLSKSAKN